MQPDLPLFQSHSSTSRASGHRAAAKSASTEVKILELLAKRGAVGATADEISQYLDITPNTAAARMRGLQLKELARKSASERDTRAGHPANVWKLPEFVPVEADRKVDKAQAVREYILNCREHLPIDEATQSHFNKIMEIIK